MTPLPTSPPRLADMPPLPPTRLLACEYVFDAETEADCTAAEDVAGLLDVYLYWRDRFAARCCRRAALN